MVEPADIHELTAGYVLDALDDGERQTAEQHLGRCTVCKEELESLRWAASALAYAAEAPAPPPALRARIVERVRSERESGVAVLRRRVALPAATALAGAAAAAAIVLAVWTASLSSTVDRERQARRAQAQALSIVATPGAARIALAGARGALLVTPERQAALVVSDLPRAPGGRIYEVWVLGPGQPLPAGIFAGGPDRSIVALTRTVPPGARIAVTIEPARGSQTVTGSLLFRSRTA